MNNKTVNFALIGTGVIGKNYLISVKTINNAAITAVCDTNETALKEAISGTPGMFGTTDYRKLLEKSDIDAVIVATNDQSHRMITVDALKAGKHVLCEKPMALTDEDCRAMLEAERKTKAKLMIGQVCRYTPSFKKAKELVEKGEIGDLFFVESEYAHDYSKIPGMKGWRTDEVNLRNPVTGGGCHAVDLLRWIAGNPTEVCAYANRKSLTDWPVDDCTVAIMKFPNNVIGKVLTSIGCQRGYTMRTCLYGTKGTIIVENQKPQFTVFKTEFCGCDHAFDNSMKAIEMKIPVQVNNHNLAAEVKEFAECIAEDRPVVTDGVEGATTVAVCNAIVNSANSGEKAEPDYSFFQKK